MNLLKWVHSIILVSNIFPNSHLIQKCIQNQQLFQNYCCWLCIHFWIKWELGKIFNTKMIGWNPFIVRNQKEKTPNLSSIVKWSTPRTYWPMGTTTWGGITWTGAFWSPLFCICRATFLLFFSFSDTSGSGKAAWTPVGKKIKTIEAKNSSFDHVNHIL